MTRIKCVHRPDMVAHLWAHQSQDSARSEGRGSLYFNGDTIYSYGRHFAIARHVVGKRKAKAVLFTIRDYSVTTSSHKSDVRSALHGLNIPVFYVAHPENDKPGEGFEDYRSRYKTSLESYAKARGRRPEIFARIKELVDEANRYAEFFGLRSRLHMPADEARLIAECDEIKRRNDESQRRRDARREKEIAAAAARRKIELQEQLTETQQHLEAWVKGGPHYWRFNEMTRAGLIATRLRIVGDELQTSLGASCPLEHAKKAFRLLAALRAKGKTYQANGHTIHVGHFQIDSMAEDGTVKAGCHAIEWSEIERVAKLAGVL